MSTVRYILFKIEKGMSYISDRFWDLMLLVNIFINQNPFQVILYILSFAAVGYFLYGLYQGLI